MSENSVRFWKDASPSKISPRQQTLDVEGSSQAMYQLKTFSKVKSPTKPSTHC